MIAQVIHVDSIIFIFSLLDQELITRLIIPILKIKKYIIINGHFNLIKLTNIICNYININDLILDD